MSETVQGLAVQNEERSSDATTMVRQIAHELRQPLSTIESIAYYLDLILPRDEPRARQQVERLQRLVEQSNWIVANAVNFVQASTPVPQDLDLRELASTSAREVSASDWLAIELGQPPPLVRLDPGQALHLFRNLLTFFRHIGPEDQSTRLTAIALPGETRIRIASAVRGYSATDVHSMFEPFSPGLPSGSGLSLASVRRIVEAHEGTVEIEAEVDTGVAITVVLPG